MDTDLIQSIWGLSPYPIAVVSLNPEPGQRKFVYSNPAFTELTGYSPAEVIGQPATLLDGHKTTAAAIKEYEAAIALRKPTTITFVHYRKNGSEYVTHTTVAPLVEPDGSVGFLLSVETVIGSAAPASPPESNAHRVLVPLHLPVPLKEFPAGDLAAHLLSHPELDALRELWARLRDDQPLPRRSDFDLGRVLQWAPHLSIATVTPEGRFQFRLFGTDLAKVYGQDLTGRFLDELTPRDVWSIVVLHYDEVVRTRQPLFAPVSIANGRWYSEVSRLLLPLAADDDDNRVAFIMGADYARF